MEDWELDFHWQKTRHTVKELMQRDTLPDLNAVLLLIGIRELGQVRHKYSKEEKQDLMHIAVCTLLEPEGYYTFEGIDDDGWPHFKQLKAMPDMDAIEQENYLKDHILLYFAEKEL